ncbi:MAG: hypothetical protein HQ559_17825 [Lentisphaerae bacterium]|nr:hypothetical protein [Lentisphaerota bacterium]
MKRIICVAMVLILAATGACADGGRVGLTAKAGTLGLGADLTVGISQQFNVRLSGNWLSLAYHNFEFELDEEIEEIPKIEGMADMSLDLLTAGAFVDWHPGGRAVRMTAGAFYNGSQLSLSVKGEGPPTGIEGFDVDQVQLDAVVNFNPVAPYVGIGWGNAAKANSHWHFALDLGLLGQGRPKLDLKATTGNPAADSALNAGLEEAIPLAEKRLVALMIVPVVTLGASYTF